MEAMMRTFQSIALLFAILPFGILFGGCGGSLDQEDADDHSPLEYYPNDDDIDDDSDDDTADANDDLNDDTSNIDDDSDDDVDDDIDDADDDSEDDFDFEDVEFASTLCSNFPFIPQDECTDALRPLYCFLQYPVYHERLFTHSEALVACREDSDPVWKDIRECSRHLREFENCFESCDLCDVEFSHFVVCLVDKGWAGERSDLFDPNLWMPDIADSDYTGIGHALGFWTYLIYDPFGRTEIGGALTGVSDLALRSQLVGVFPRIHEETSTNLWYTGSAIEIAETEIVIRYDYFFYWSPDWRRYCNRYESPCAEYVRLLPVQ
jgi:hypothetical protein